MYDLERHEAHCLNPSAVHVFKRCDGQTTVAELATRARRELGAEVDERWVDLALDGLEQAHLLERGSTPTSSPDSTGRRELLRRAGLGAALLLPAVVSMVAPTPAEAAGTCVPEPQCSTAADNTPCYPVPPGNLSDCDLCSCVAGLCSC